MTSTATFAKLFLVHKFSLLYDSQFYLNICFYYTTLHSAKSSSTLTPSTFDSAFNSMSFINRSPLSIFWTAFLSMSCPMSCSLSASARCEQRGDKAFLMRATFTPAILFLFLNLFLYISNDSQESDLIKFDIYWLSIKLGYVVIYNYLTSNKCHK